MHLKSKTWVASELAGSAFPLIVTHALVNGFSCFYFCFVHGRRLSHWRSLYSRWATDPVGGSRTPCLFINWAICLEGWETLTSCVRDFFDVDAVLRSSRRYSHLNIEDRWNASIANEIKRYFCRFCTQDNKHPETLGRAKRFSRKQRNGRVLFNLKTLFIVNQKSAPCHVLLWPLSLLMDLAGNSLVTNKTLRF